jgi:L-amino acid N-acyltransferase YncA
MKLSGIQMKGARSCREFNAADQVYFVSIVFLSEERGKRVGCLLFAYI